MQPQFELHLRNTANGTEFRIKHNSEQHAPLSAFADGLHLLTISSLEGSTLEAQLTQIFKLFHWFCTLTEEKETMQLSKVYDEKHQLN